MNQNTIEGKIATTGRGTGYIKSEDDQPDILIEEGKLATALPGDTVRVQIFPDLVDDRGEKKRGGIVTAILSRAREQFVGTVTADKNDSGQILIQPDNNRIYTRLALRKEDSEKVSPDKKILVFLDKWDKGEESPTVGLLKVLGDKGVHETEIQSIIYEKGFDSEFPAGIEDEAKSLKQKWTPIPEDEIEKRRDLRNEDVMTIDPYDAKDFDDALHVKALENGNYEVGIHIADVAHYVTPGSDIDKEAFERATSVYLVDRTIPMLPEVLSNDLCSLNPNEEKLAFSAIFELNKNAEVQNRWFGRTVIESKRRFTYEEAQAILDADSGDYIDELRHLNNFSKILAKRNKEAGSIEFESEEIKFVLDEKGHPIKIIKKEPLETHKLVEHMMLLANREVAKFIHDKGKEFGGPQRNLIYRNHDVPNKEKVGDLMLFLKGMGYHLRLNDDGELDARALNNLFNEIEGKPEEQLIKTASVRTMSKAIYGNANEGHFGLAFDFYTHFTSPIRRYPDLLVHRVLATFLAGNKLDDRDLDKLEKGAVISTEREISAAEAERESIKYKQAEYMQDHIGEEYDGVISGVTPFGIFVQVKETLSEGLIHISKLGDEFFSLDEKNYAVVGEKSGKKFHLGDEVRVKIESIDVDQKKIDMSLVEGK
jgi:ribonuclease R